MLGFYAVPSRRGNLSFVESLCALLPLACGALATAATFAGCSSNDQPESPPADASTEDSVQPEVDASSKDIAVSEADAFVRDTAPEEAAPGDADGAADSSDADATDCVPGPSGEPTDLRCTGLYSDWPSKTVSTSARSYDPGLSQWKDGASQTRWIYLPAGQGIDTSNMDEWMFPAGTKLWQEVVLGGKRIETRLLSKLADASWDATTYRWSADESTALEVIDGVPNADGNGYEIPAQSTCALCHAGRLDYVLGFEAVSLSSANASGLTLSALVSQGLLSAPPASPIRIPGTATDVAALGYLHANCGTACHNIVLGSQAGSTGFEMRLDVSTLSSVQTTDTWTTGWNQPTNFPTQAGAPMRLSQCSTTLSAVYYRMTHRDGLNEAGAGVQMPPLDTHKIDSVGASLIAAWINQGCSDAGPDAAQDGGSDATADARSD
jgi:hypothetical protein